MNLFTLVFGIALIGTGFVTLVRRVHDRTIHQALTQVWNGRGDAVPAVSGFVALLVPIVSSIAGGMAFAAVGLLGQSRPVLSWLGW